MRLAAPTRHFASLAQAVLYRGAGLSIVGPQRLATGCLFFLAALRRFRRSLQTLQA